MVHLPQMKIIVVSELVYQMQDHAFSAILGVVVADPPWENSFNELKR